jgi:MFS family permease
VSGTLFAVALGYGTLVPLVPVYLGASGGGDVVWHTGALPAVFLAAASLAAPLWGHVSDRIGRRVVIAAGCAGAALAVVPFLVEHGLAQLYLLQAVAGVSFGAVLPAALAMLYETGDARSRVRRVAWYGVALLGGYLAGPALGGWLAGLAEGAAALAAQRAVQLALGAQAAAAALALLRVFGGHWPKADSPRETPAPAPRAQDALATLLAAMLVALLLGGFEIGTALHLRGPLGFGSAEVAGLFIACGATMALVQLVLLPRVPASASRVAWALGLVAASGARRGLALGAQNSAITGGQAAGSVLGGALFAALGERALAGFGAAIIALALALAALSKLRRA